MNLIIGSYVFTAIFMHYHPIGYKHDMVRVPQTITISGFESKESCEAFHEDWIEQYKLAYKDRESWVPMHTCITVRAIPGR